MIACLPRALRIAPRSVLLLFSPLLLAGWLSVLPTSAAAGEVSFKLEPGVAIPLGAPQSEIYDVGGSQSLKALFGITPYLDLGPTVSFVFLSPGSPGTESGVVWAVGPGLRLKRPHTAESLGGVSPWADIDALYIRTGDLNRAGLDAAVGVSLPVGESRNFWLGPFVRFLHVFQPSRVGYDDGDAKVLTIGLSVEVGSGAAPKAAPPEIRTVTRDVVREVVKEVPVVSCPDGDHDNVPDSVDRCPEVVGSLDDWGCPHYDKLVVQRDKLELKEKLYFGWNQSRLQPASFPVLDEVARAMKDNPGFRVQVQGHTDSTGNDDRNQTLSEERAAAVLDYLTSRGVSKERLASKGFSSSAPVGSNSTAAGREKNRRVEFVVHFVILNSGSAK